MVQAPQLTRRFDAVEARHGDVEHDDIRMEPLRFNEEFLSIADFTDHQTFGISQSSHPATPAVPTADGLKSRLAHASGRRHHTSTCTSASVKQADTIVGHMMVTQLMVSQWLLVGRTRRCVLAVEENSTHL